MKGRKDRLWTEKKLMETALELGFADAALIRTDELVFIPAFRALCEENECGNTASTTPARRTAAQWKR